MRFRFPLFRRVPQATDAGDYFQVEHLQRDIAARSARGGVFVMGGQFAKFVISLAATFVLARLLTPRDYGIVGMVTVFTGFVALFQDMGLSHATVQKNDLNGDQVNGVFWVTMGVNALLFLIVCAAAPVVAWFNDEPRLIAVTLVLAVLFLIHGATAQHRALMLRQMQFRTLVTVDVLSLAIGMTAAIAGAAWSRNYWALVAGQVATALISAGALWSVCSWRPKIARRKADIGGMLRYGGNLTAFNLVNYWTRNLDNLLIGWRWGAQPLGLYSRAYGLLMLPIQQINNPLASICIPALSRLAHDPARFRVYYCTALRVVAYATTPLIVIMAALADEIVLVVLGPQWKDAAIIFKVLAVAAFGQPIASAMGWLYASLGRTDRMVRWALVSSPIFALGFVAGLPYGPLGVAVAFAATDHLLRYVGICYALYGSPVRVRDVAAAVLPALTVGALMYLAMELTAWLIAPANSLVLTIGATAAVGVLVGAASVALWGGERRALRGILRVLLSSREPRIGPSPKAPPSDLSPEDHQPSSLVSQP